MTQTQTETKNKKASRINGLGGFKVDKIDGDLMRAYIAKHKLEIEIDDVTDEQIGVALSMHFKKVVSAEDQVRCDLCTAISSAEEECCPFCGDAGDVEGDQDELAASAEDDQDDQDAQDAQPAVSAADDEDDEDDLDDEDEPAANADLEDKLDAALAAGDAEEKAAVAPPAPKKTATKKTTKKETAMPTTEATTKMNGHSKKGSIAALAKVAPAGVMGATDLDAAVREVERLKGSAAEGYWMLGKKLLEINAKQLWKLRVDDKGKAKYKSWDSFVHAELKMSPQNAYAAIDCAKEYETPEEVRELGHTKATLLLKAAPEDRPAIKEKIKAGATANDVRAATKESRKKHGAPKSGQHAKAGTKGGASKAKATEKVSITSFEGTKTIKLYKRPDTLKDLDLSKCKRATKLADLPFGRIEMANGLVQYISVILKDGEIYAKLETRRED